MRRLGMSLLVWFVMCSVAQSSFAQGKGKPILDQFNFEVQDSAITGSSDFIWQQGVTAGVSGQLVRVDLYVTINPNVEPSATEVSVLLGPPWQSGLPVWSVTAVLKAGWNSFNLTKAKIFVEPGDEFVIGMHGTTSPSYANFPISYGDQYPGGDLYLSGSLNSEVNDIWFRTYVKPNKK